jgi:hypothetical protein
LTNHGYRTDGVSPSYCRLDRAHMDILGVTYLSYALAPVHPGQLSRSIRPGFSEM